MADVSALQARVEQEMRTLKAYTWKTPWRSDEVYLKPAVEALVIRLLTEQQLQEEEIQRLQARVEPLEAGADGQDL